MMMTQELEETFTYYVRRKPVHHPVHKFLEECHLLPEHIAASFGVTEVAVRSWLWGRAKPSQKHEKKLWELKESLDRYAAKHGFKFDGRKFKE